MAAQGSGNGQGPEWLNDAHDWRSGLATGPNGPIPAIVIDQFGYRPGDRKIAVIRDPDVGYDSTARFLPGSRYAVVNAETKQIVKEAPLAPWRKGAVDPVSGDRAWWFDFSDVSEPGTYNIVDLDKRVRSPSFRIASDVYKPVMKAAMRTFYLQRAGFEKLPAIAGPWADKASHLGRGQDSEARPWPGSTRNASEDARGKRDLRGGWYDAGDYNKYTSWTARVVILLLRAFKENPGAFDDATLIPESGNGVPDLLDEVKWGLEWLIRMQNSDGSLLCVQGLAGGSPPSSATGPSFYGPATTSATLAGAAAFAFAAKVYASRPEDDFRQFGAELTRRAISAWNWAASNHDARFYNNDNQKQPGSAGLAAGQQEMTDDVRNLVRFEAALYLFELTGDATYRSFADEHVGDVDAPHGPTQWAVFQYEAMLAYLSLEHVPPDLKRRVLAKFSAGMERTPFQAEALRENLDPYMAPMKDYTWGSNQGKMYQARMYQLYARQFQGQETARAVQRALGGFIHYIHGVNPLGLVYLTNMNGVGAAHSASTAFHAWFAAGTKWSEVTSQSPGPAPGFVVGGPNPSYSLAGCCTAPAGTFGFRCDSLANQRICSRNYEPPLKQPPMKAYLQFNTTWPANSWEISEPSTGYQANYILVLSAFLP